MPFRPQHSLLKIDVDKMHTIDTRSVENLFGMWSVFSKISEAMEDGKRLENLSWRLWNRETFCCRPETHSRSSHAGKCPLSQRAKHIPQVPALSSSVSSNESVEDDDESSPLPSPMVRPELRSRESSEYRSRGYEKHITPIDLEKMVISIQEKKNLEPLSPISLPPSSPDAECRRTIAEPRPAARAPEPTQSQKQPISSTPTIITTNHLESSTSTVSSNASDDSNGMASSESSSTEMSTHNIVRGFAQGAPSSYRSQTHLPMAPAPILKSSPQYTPSRRQAAAKKGATFTLGASSGEDESSLESHMTKNNSSSLSAQLSKPSKNATFKELAKGRAITESPVFEESDDEEDEDEDAFESVIEEDEDSSDWEDEVVETETSSADDRGLFQRVDSRPNITSRRSMLTTLMHEPDRARALANYGPSRSASALRRSRATSPNGPSATPPPQQQQHHHHHQQQSEALALRNGPESSCPQPIIMTTSNTHQPALSPKTTRRNMLSTELTESLRKNLLWERQHKSSNNLAAMKRRHTSQDVKNLKQYPEPQPVMSVKDTNNFSNEYFHQGLQEYHAKGW
ncbi:hypothetical protein MBLNU459_g5879t1 [Dothideomycetes sp. NU459]